MAVRAARGTGGPGRYGYLGTAALAKRQQIRAILQMAVPAAVPKLPPASGCRKKPMAHAGTLTRRNAPLTHGGKKQNTRDRRRGIRLAPAPEATPGAAPGSVQQPLALMRYRAQSYLEG